MRWAMLKANPITSYGGTGKFSNWSPEEDAKLIKAALQHHRPCNNGTQPDWTTIHREYDWNGRSQGAVIGRYQRLRKSVTGNKSARGIRHNIKHVEEKQIIQSCVKATKSDEIAWSEADRKKLKQLAQYEPNQYRSGGIRWYAVVKDFNEWRSRQKKGPRTAPACLEEFRRIRRTGSLEVEEMSEEEKAHCAMNRKKESLKKTETIRKEKGIKDVLSVLDPSYSWD